MQGLELEVGENLDDYVEELEVLIGEKTENSSNASGRKLEVYEEVSSLLNQKEVDSPADIEDMLREFSDQSITSGSGVTVVKSESQIAGELYRGAYERLD